MDAADVICTTPEKFDAMTRRGRDRGGMRFFNEVGLLLIDEVHLLSESRGASLEAGVVSRIKLVASRPEMAGVREGREGGWRVIMLGAERIFVPLVSARAAGLPKVHAAGHGRNE